MRLFEDASRGRVVDTVRLLRLLNNSASLPTYGTGTGAVTRHETRRRSATHHYEP
jgi:hypothetical protein